MSSVIVVPTISLDMGAIRACIDVGAAIAEFERQWAEAVASIDASAYPPDLIDALQGVKAHLTGVVWEVFAMRSQPPGTRRPSVN